MKFFLLLILFFPLSSLLRADDEFSKETVKATPITPTMYLLEGAGGNITASIGTSGVLLVDDDFAPMADKISKKLKDLKGGLPRFIINTHFHYDHTGGNDALGVAATIIATPEVQKRLRSEQTLWKKTHPATSPRNWPTLTYEKSLSLYFNGDEVKVVHLPAGHTDGDSVVFFRKRKVVSMGDLYFSGMFPIFHPEHGGSLEGYLRNIENVLEQIGDDWTIVPGHGPLSTKGELTKYHQMILDCLRVVKTEMAEGRSLDEIKKKGLPVRWDSFSHGYANADRWISLLYQALVK